METEELIFHNSSQRKEIKEFSQTFPDIRIAIFPAAFIIESINLSDLSGLMISPQNGDSVLVPHFECNEKSDGFN